MTKDERDLLLLLADMAGPATDNLDPRHKVWDLASKLRGIESQPPETHRHLHFHVPEGAELAAEGDVVIIRPTRDPDPPEVSGPPKVHGIQIVINGDYMDPVGDIWTIESFSDDPHEAYLHRTWIGTSRGRRRRFDDLGICLDVSGGMGDLVQGLA